jgi:hypothetical protein
MTRTIKKVYKKINAKITKREKRNFDKDAVG